MIIIILDIGQLVQILLLCQTCLLFNVSQRMCQRMVPNSLVLRHQCSQREVGESDQCFWELFSFKPRISSSFCIKTHWWFQCISLLLELYDPLVL